MVTYDFDYSAKNDLLVGLTLTQSKAANALIIHPILLDRIGIPWDGTSVAGWGLGRLNNFNGYPLKNIGWTIEIGGAKANTNGGVGETIGIRLIFDNADVMDITYRNDLWHFKYTTLYGSYTTCGSGQGGSNSNWLKITSTINGNDRRFKFEWADNLSVGNTYPPSSPNYTLHGADPFFTVTGGKGNWITDMSILGETDNPITIANGGNNLHVVHIETSDTLFTGAIVGFDASIPIGSYTLRTALNAGGNGIVTAPNPFFEVSAATLKAQLKKALTYTNAFGVKQWEGETTTLDMSNHEATYECAEMIRKTMGVEVLASPIIFSTFLRQWNGLVIEDKDGDFVNRGVTTSHIIAFAKADTKTYQGRATRDAFTIVDEDFSTPLVPDITNNGLDEEMYYQDAWNSDDSTQAHIMLHAGDSDKWFAVKYPVDIYEKFNNLTKLNKLEIISTISAARTSSLGDWSDGSGNDARYVYYLYNYQTSAFEEIQNFSKNDLKGDSVLTSAPPGNAFYYTPRDLSINVTQELKSGVGLWLIGTTYSSGDRAIHNDVLYTYINGTPSSGQEPPDTKWQRTVYDFINYESTAGSAPIFSKLNIITAIRTPNHLGGITFKGIWVWDFSVRATFDEDNEPEYSTASISVVSATTITLDATSGINLPEKDGFGVGDIISIIKNIEDYLQDSWDVSPIATDLGALTINIANSTTIGVLEDHTYKSFFALMQHISELSNSTFWANYATTNTVLISSAGNHTASGVPLTKADLYNYDESNWSISYDAKPQKNKVRILGDNVNFIKTLSPALDPFDLGDETEIIDDSDIQTLLQASNMADALTPRMEGSEVIVRLTLDYSNPNQNYSTIKVGNTVVLQLPTSADTSIFNDTLLIMAIDLNRNESTGDNEHATLTLQKRYS